MPEMSRQSMLERLVSALDVQVAPFAICAVGKGWCLDLPGPSEVMLHFVLEGEGQLGVPEGPARPLEPCDLAIIPPGIVHQLELAGATQHGLDVAETPEGGLTRLVAGSFDDPSLMVACGLVRVKFGESLGLFDHLREVLVVSLSDVPDARTTFSRILEEQSHPSLGSETVTKALMSQCLVWLLRKLSAEGDCPLPWLAALEDERLARSIDRVMDDPGANHTVESLAEVAGMSRSAFARHFSSAFDRSPMNLVHHIRMQRAGQLLLQGALSVDEIASRVGFSSRSHFSRAFREHTGSSPRAYGESAATA